MRDRNHILIFSHRVENIYSAVLILSQWMIPRLVPLCAHCALTKHQAKNGANNKTSRRLRVLHRVAGQQAVSSSRRSSSCSKATKAWSQKRKTRMTLRNSCKISDSPGEFCYLKLLCQCWLLFVISSTRMGESQPGNSVLHRVLGRTQKFGFAHKQSSLADVGWVASRSLSGDALGWQQFGEFCVGELHERSSQTWWA